MSTSVEAPHQSVCRQRHMLFPATALAMLMVYKLTFNWHSNKALLKIVIMFIHEMNVNCQVNACATVRTYFDNRNAWCGWIYGRQTTIICEPRTMNRYYQFDRRDDVKDHMKCLHLLMWTIALCAGSTCSAVIAQFNVLINSLMAERQYEANDIASGTIITGSAISS